MPSPGDVPEHFARTTQRFFVTRATTTFVSDLDGTLLTNQATVSEFTERVVNEVSSSHNMVLATGRPPRLVKSFAATFPNVRSVICANGAFHLDLMTGELTQFGTIDGTAALEIVHRIKKADPGAAFAVESVVGHRREHGYASDHPVPERLYGTIEDIVKGGIAKMLIRLSHPVDRAGADQLSNIVGDLGVLTVSNPTFYEVAPAGVTKATGVAALDLTGDTVAYGDMPNDIALLEWADLGVAVANADRDVRAAAQCVLDLTNDEDAVALHMVRLLGLNLR